MPVTIIPGSHGPKPHPSIKAAASVDELLRVSCPDVYIAGETRIVAASSGLGDYPSSSSFVRCVIEAWGRHSHLVLRPDDIWFTILVQMNFYIEKHAESLRHLFVSHKGKERLEVWDFTWQRVINEFREEIDRKVKTPWLKDWITPGFSTSTDDDETTATVLMMGLMKAYFDYAGGVICGIPSITLLGLKQDWQRLLAKTERLQEFGAEPRDYARRLRPILTRIVRSFDSPATAESQDFWDQMVQAKLHHSDGCGEPPLQYIVSGWILGFFYWNATGDVSRIFSEGLKQGIYCGDLEYDQVHYGESPLEKLPIGYAKAEFTMLNNNGEDRELHGWLLAGSIGKTVIQGAPAGYKALLGRQYHETEWTSPENKSHHVSLMSGSTTVAEKGDKASYMSGSTAAQNDTSGTGCFSGMFCGLRAFVGKRFKHTGGSLPGTTHSSNEAMALTHGNTSCSIHSTMQPTSGWVLFGPDKEVYPFFKGEEIDGPTVDAINGCGDIAHTQ